MHQISSGMTRLFTLAASPNPKYIKQLLSGPLLNTFAGLAAAADADAADAAQDNTHTHARTRSGGVIACHAVVAGRACSQ